MCPTYNVLLRFDAIPFHYLVHALLYSTLDTPRSVSTGMYIIWFVWTDRKSFYVYILQRKANIWCSAFPPDVQHYVFSRRPLLRREKIIQFRCSTRRPGIHYAITRSSFRGNASGSALWCSCLCFAPSSRPTRTGILALFTSTISRREKTRARGCIDKDALIRPVNRTGPQRFVVFDLFEQRSILPFLG